MDRKALLSAASLLLPRAHGSDPSNANTYCTNIAAVMCTPGATPHSPGIQGDTSQDPQCLRPCPSLRTPRPHCPWGGWAGWRGLQVPCRRPWGVRRGSLPSLCPSPNNPQRQWKRASCSPPPGSRTWGESAPLSPEAGGPGPTAPWGPGAAERPCAQAECTPPTREAAPQPPQTLPAGRW